MKPDFTYGFNNHTGGFRPAKQIRSFRPPKPSPDSRFVQNFLISTEAYEAIKSTLGVFPAETGGLLLGDPKTGLITDFLFDADARTSGAIYYPTVEFLNREIPRYEAQGKHPLGIAHSHPAGIIRPSGPDMSAAYSNITSPHNQHLKTWHMPIIQSTGDVGRFEFYPYIVSCSDDPGETILHMPTLQIVDLNYKTLSKEKIKFKMKNVKAKENLPSNSVADASVSHHFKISANTLARLKNEYSRVAGQVDFDKMLDTSIIHVGVGASSTSIEQFSRIGIKRWVLFDHDRVEKKNLVAQDFETADIGKLKAEAIKERMERCEFEKDALDVPSLNVTVFGDFLAPSDATLDQLIEHEKKTYGRVILVAATDYHPAQARASRLGIRHEIPTFFIGAYRDGLAGEMIFYHPKAKNMPCYRCITASRYKAFDERPPESQGAAKSSGLPFGIGVLDSQLAHLIVGCIHYTYPENEAWPGYGRSVVPHADFTLPKETNKHADLFRDLVMENRNFIQTQLNPGYRMAGEDIFRDENGVHGENVKTFISMFQIDEKKMDCPDCSSPKAWWHTDYRVD
ncbi:ThiF family adenylyltransferase [Hydrogenophaga sp. RWCD_12]|uniref:ThiF family adenylyltransferase n=1 Tax=Hydrogenophaga sp. RWCD_12 TaxID=3391190 RepID=UPI00398539D1